MPIVSGFGVAGPTAAFGIVAGLGKVSAWAAFAAGAAETAVAAAATGAAIGLDPVTDFARAAGVSIPLFGDAIAAAGVVTVFVTLAAGAPASVFFGGADSPPDELVRLVDLNESRIFVAAAASCARMCGICT